MVDEVLTTLTPDDDAWLAVSAKPEWLEGRNTAVRHPGLVRGLVNSVRRGREPTKEKKLDLSDSFVDIDSGDASDSDRMTVRKPPKGFTGRQLKPKAQGEPWDFIETEEFSDTEVTTMTVSARHPALPTTTEDTGPICDISGPVPVNLPTRSPATSFLEKSGSSSSSIPHSRHPRRERRWRPMSPYPRPRGRPRKPCHSAAVLAAVLAP
ncbi:hypothetical protein F5Y11DRAFT_47905 [Daldinia sp. FL1419]|nr:hypothetical protein F5Y11DRAFT_47905 [Daldinia sp. FL1419]